MRNRIFTVVLVWTDGEVEDADEVQVFAPSVEEAAREAKRKWRTTVAIKWPHCVLRDVLITGPATKSREPARPSV